MIIRQRLAQRRQLRESCQMDCAECVCSRRHAELGSAPLEGAENVMPHQPPALTCHTRPAWCP